ncbi:MAG: response regulator [Chloroflexi bacterium]|nr:MAG: response regulator [Chloroflexota bacterium]
MNTILIVEDQPEMAVLIRAILKPLGYEILVAKNGQEAIILADQYVSSLTLIILDLLLPGETMDGISVAEYCKKTHPHLSRVPILAVTAGRSEELFQDAMRAGCDALLVKPFSPQELREVVNSLLATA